MTFNIRADSSSIAEDLDMERDAMNHPPHPADAPCPEDTIRWSDGTECYRYELDDMAYMSDDYEVIKFIDTCPL